MQLGSASAGPGERATGYLEMTGVPTGGSERLPVVIARGESDGPTLWVTGGVHGNELTGVATVQDVLADGVPAGLCGTVVCVPIVSPSGLRRVERTSYYHGDDPNRYFPAEEPDEGDDPRVQELIGTRLYELIVASADALVDVHTAQVGSVPFVIRDRVLYDEDGDRTESQARELADRLDAFADAIGLPVINEYPAEEYVDRNLDRSAAGAVLNRAGIPSLTLELGSYGVVEEANRAAGVAAVYRTMVHLGMLEAVPERVDARSIDPPVDFPVRRFRGPNAPRAGICRHHLEAGEAFEAGDELATLVSPHGDPLETIPVDHDGYVLGRANTVCYENDPVTSLAVRDEGPLVAPRE
ncbi:succinylglutamate desuccinylase/aspartoacylase family protein [Halovivax gelatinilyticus]|uniref:succinylglutamate desuccinylase/aspartoacylase family protein n=1 Tax=Halovivax gelatinilyticus TaxID=2961597 RepID=UPI0020CA6CCB|nr:succinylglutamate desuccinylase/aspartoacylase family protein [Halovivax gelatinilyticus]